MAGVLPGMMFFLWMDQSMSMEDTSFEGLAGAIDCAIEWPETPVRGWALVLHPHPLHGGARDNKIVTTIARACVQSGLVAVRPDFRGVGASAGEFDNAVGETLDMRELVRQFTQRYPQAAAGKWLLAGFSFGTAVAAQLYSMLEQETREAQAGAAVPPVTPEEGADASRGVLPGALVLVGTAVRRFEFREVVVPGNTLLIHGESDEVVPFAEAVDFARAHDLPVVMVPDASHFFHGKLILLRRLVQDYLLTL